MRLGGPIARKDEGPEDWVRLVREEGYRAANCPVGSEAEDAEVEAYRRAAEGADIVIAEVGAWSNPLSADAEARKEAIRNCRDKLALAERIGARCCVNITGSRGEKWDGPHEKNLTDETFEMIVETTRAIIDAVQPTRTFYTLESMPWMYPDSPDSYGRLVEAIDRPAFGVHLDPVNWVCSPQRYFGNADLLRESFAKLGPHIRSCHAKDIALAHKLTTHLDEVRPGTGGLDYGVYLDELGKLDPDVTLMLEHLPSIEEYRLAADHIRAVAAERGVAL